MFMNQKYLFVTFFVFLLTGTSSFADDQSFFGKKFSPQNIASAISEKGLNEVYMFISSSTELQSQLRKRLASGDPEWLDLFIPLRQDPESEWGGQLDLYLAYTIENNPESALRIMQKYQKKYQDYFTVNMLPSYASLICGNVNEDWALGCVGYKTEGRLPDKAHETLNQRSMALSKLNNPDLSDIKQACMQRIIEAKNFWEKFCK